MPNSDNGRFRCIHCGQRFDLDKHEMEIYEQGFYAIEPDCCDDCYSNNSFAEYPDFSDADPGL